MHEGPWPISQITEYGRDNHLLCLAQFLRNQKGHSIQTCSIDMVGEDLLIAVMHIAPSMIYKYYGNEKYPVALA